MSDKDLTPKPVTEAMPFDGMFFSPSKEEKKEVKKPEVKTEVKPVVKQENHKKEKKDRRVTLVISESDFAIFEAMCEEEGLSMSTYLGKLIKTSYKKGEGNRFNW